VEAILALGAALLFALGTVLQQKEAAAAPGEQALKAGFLLRLARRPVWLAGMAADGAGYVCQAAALGVGRLVVVQPLLASTVVFALPIGGWILGQRAGRREWISAAVVTAGLGAFLILADPTGGRDDATTAGWAVIGAVAVPLCGGLVLASRGRQPAMKASLLGIATGILWGISAALTKAVVEGLNEGIVFLLTNWHLYALIAVGWASLTLAQASLQAGALAPAVATQATLDPISSVLIGILAFDESLDASALGIAGAGLALAAMIAGLAVLAARAPEAQATA
jgi:drug/metabolite transporter (DMT)-like permease